MNDESEQITSKENEHLADEVELLSGNQTVNLTSNETELSNQRKTSKLAY